MGPFDAGNIDGPRYYGSTKTDKFKNQFPNGFKPIYDKAKSFGCRLGVWLGPDGFGDTPEQAWDDAVDSFVTGDMAYGKEEFTVEDEPDEAD